MMTDLNIVSNDELTHQMIHTCTEIFTEKKHKSQSGESIHEAIEANIQVFVMTRSDFNTSLDLYHLKMAVM